MKISGRGVAFIKQFENCCLRAYRDIGGVITCGWGSTGPDIGADTVWDQDQADARLAAFLVDYSDRVSWCLHVPVNQNQFDALVSLSYNIGIGAFRDSTLLAELNQDRVLTAADQFLVWDKAGGQVSSGLERRRQAERALFLTPVS